MTSKLSGFFDELNRDTSIAHAIARFYKGVSTTTGGPDEDGKHVLSLLECLSSFSDILELDPEPDAFLPLLRELGKSDKFHAMCHDYMEELGSVAKAAAKPERSASEHTSPHRFEEIDSVVLDPRRTQSVGTSAPTGVGVDNPLGAFISYINVVPVVKDDQPIVVLFLFLIVARTLLVAYRRKMKNHGNSERACEEMLEEQRHTLAMFCFCTVFFITQYLTQFSDATSSSWDAINWLKIGIAKMAFPKSDRVWKHPNSAKMLGLLHDMDKTAFQSIGFKQPGMLKAAADEMRSLYVATKYYKDHHVSMFTGGQEYLVDYISTGFQSTVGALGLSADEEERELTFVRNLQSFAKKVDNSRGYYESVDLLAQIMVVLLVVLSIHNAALLAAPWLRRLKAGDGTTTNTLLKKQLTALDKEVANAHPPGVPNMGWGVGAPPGQNDIRIASRRILELGSRDDFANGPLLLDLMTRLLAVRRISWQATRGGANQGSVTWAGQLPELDDIRNEIRQYRLDWNAGNRNMLQVRSNAGATSVVDAVFARMHA